jgi:fibronectin-binding autotransporter adhesin
MYPILSSNSYLQRRIASKLQPARLPVRPLLAMTGMVLCLGLTVGNATVITKEISGTDLTVGAGWVGGTGPGFSDVATWGTPSTASLGGALTIGAGVSWQGIDIQNATANVAITGTGALTIGVSGITIAAAGKDLSLQGSSGNGGIVIGGSQIWSIGTGRTLTVGHGLNTLNQGLSGAGNISITGGGTVAIKPGDTGALFSGGGNAAFTGNWEIGSGVRVTNYRNGANAWGTGSITLSGGTIAPTVGNWTWTNNISLTASTNSTIEDGNTSGSGRFLKLQGIISGSGNVNFNDPSNRMTAEGGFIITGTNTMSGTITLGANADLRVGGVAGNDTTTGVGSSGTLGTANVALSASTSTLTLSRNDTWTFANDLSGSGVLRIGLNTGSATHLVTVSGNNTHSGGTILQSAVTLKVGSSNALGSGTFTIAGNGFFDNVTGGALTVANAITLSGGSPAFLGTDDMIINGAGLLSGANRTITVSAKTLTLGGNIAEDVAGRGLTKDGAGTLVLTGTNAYTGTTTINAGTLTVSGGAAIANASNVVLANSAGVTFKLNSSETIAGLSGGGTTGGTVDVNGQILTVTPPAAHSDFNGALIGAGTLIKAGANQLRLGGTNTFSGTHQIDAGLLVFTSTGSDNGLPNVVINGDANSGIVIGDVFAAGELTIGSLSGTGGKVRADWNPTPGQRTLSVTQSTDTSFAGTLEDATAGRIIGLKKSGNGILTLTSAQPYTGTTVIAGGTVALSGNGALVDAAAVSLTSATSSFSLAAITAASETIGSLTGVANSTLILGGKGLIISGNADAEFSGNASGSGGSITKQGTGTLKLSGSNSYTGSTNMTAGTLLLGSATALPSTATLSLSGGTLKTDGYDASTGPLSVSDALANIIDFTSNTSSLSFADSHAVTWTGLLKIFNWDGGVWDHSAGTEFLLFPNAGSLTSGQLASIQFYSNDGTTPIGAGAGFLAGTGELVPVPEPGAVLAGFGLLGLVWYRERRQVVVQSKTAAAR